MFQDLLLWCEGIGQNSFFIRHLYLFIGVSVHFSFLFSSPVLTESVCTGQNICVHLCACLPLTWNNSSSFIDVEPPRLSKQNPALNGWLYLLLRSYASDLLSFHPQNCCFCHGPFGNIHRHTCAPPLYKNECVPCVNMDTHSHSYTQASKHACRTVQQLLVSFLLTVHLQPRCAVYSEVLLSAGCFAFPLWNKWGVPVGHPSGCISLCVMGICLPRPLVGQLRGFGHVR